MMTKCFLHSLSHKPQCKALKYRVAYTLHVYTVSHAHCRLVAWPFKL